MKEYWSCSKFADWLRGTPKPFSGTSEEWDAWEKKAKIKKFRYWLAEEGLDYLQNFIYWPANCIHRIRCYIDNRWVTKTHALTSNLKRGNWYDFDTRLLHALFDELVNFVEIELAWKLIICSEEDRKKYKTPWYHLSRWRNPEAGIAHLKWAADLKNDNDWADKNDPSYGQPTRQALAAQEMLQLYRWWKEERPKRPDPSDASGWRKYCEEKSNETKISDQGSKILNIYHKMEKEQEEEDTEMLVRLIKCRQGMWT